MTRPNAFTMDHLSWKPWLETVDEGEPTEEQLELLNKVVPSPDSRRYYATLAHDAPVLRERTGLFNAIMYGPRGLSRAERELATVAASRFNGCIYCTSVHARAYVNLTKSSENMQRLLDEGVYAPWPEREEAIINFAVRLTDTPHAMTAADLRPLRCAGLTDLEILDLTHAVAMFANANRLMQTLGEPEIKE